MNPETVAALLDVTWHVTDAERARTESLDRKAASLATFVSLILAVIATLAPQLLGGRESVWLLLPFALELVALAVAAAFAVAVLLPKEHVGLSMKYLERFPNWSEIRKEPAQVQGEAMFGLIEAIAKERAINQRKARMVRFAYQSLFVALLVAAVLGATLGLEEVRG